MKKKYLIVGDNNFWYATTGEISEKELDAELKEVQRGIKAGEYTDNEMGEPNELFAYEANEVKRIKL